MGSSAGNHAVAEACGTVRLAHDPIMPWLALLLAMDESHVIGDAHHLELVEYRKPGSARRVDPRRRWSSLLLSR